MVGSVEVYGRWVVQVVLPVDMVFDRWVAWLVWLGVVALEHVLALLVQREIAVAEEVALE